MRYTKTLNIWQLTPAQIAALPIGQWVTTTTPEDKTAKGIFLGVKESGSVVVAWYMNAKSNDYRDYIKTLRQWARSTK